MIASWVLFSALCGAGCSTHSDNVGLAISKFKLGDDIGAIAIFQQGCETKRNRPICLLETGRLHQLAGRAQTSRQIFSQLIDEVAEIEEGAVIRLRDVGGTALASTLTDDRTIPYRVPGYELVMVLQEQAWSHLFCGDLDAAAVEMRRAVYAQNEIARQHEKEIAETQQKMSEQKGIAAFKSKLDNHYVAMAPVLGRAKSSFQNPYVWYMSGLFYEALNESGNAYISYKRAWELMPGNRYIQRDVLRLARGENAEEFDAFAKRFSTVKQDMLEPGLGAELIVIFEEGLISRRYSESGAFPIPMPKGGITYQTLSFPVYRDATYQPVPLGVKIDGKSHGRTAVLCFLQSLAYHDLMEKMPGVMLRNLTRGISRAIGQQALADQGTGYQIASLVWQVVNVAADQGDTRAWSTMPMAVQLGRFPVEPGPHKLEMINEQSGLRTALDLQVAKGEHKIVWLADVGGRATACVADLGTSRGGQPIPVRAVASILDTPTFTPGTLATSHAAVQVATTTPAVRPPVRTAPPPKPAPPAAVTAAGVADKTGTPAEQQASTPPPEPSQEMDVDKLTFPTAQQADSGPLPAMAAAPAPGPPPVTNAPSASEPVVETQAPVPEPPQTELPTLPQRKKKPRGRIVVF